MIQIILFIWSSADDPVYFYTDPDPAPWKKRISIQADPKKIQIKLGIGIRL